MLEEVTIDHMGANGDGVAKTRHGAVYVPFTLPSEVANIAIKDQRGMVMALKKKSKQRIDAVCDYFEQCGGCTLQHWLKTSYQDWKRHLVVHAIEGRGIDCVVENLIEGALHSRRRMTLTARVTSKGQIIGFNRVLSHDVIAIDSCPVSHPKLVKKLPAIRAICAILANHAKEMHITITMVDNGFDVAIKDISVPDDNIRQRLLREALKQEITRLSIEGEIIVEREKPILHFGSVAVELAAGGFLQATVEAENIMAELVMAGLKKAKNAADLFSGAGTFTFRMAEKMNVHAVESDGDALKSLDRAIRNASGQKNTGLKTITHEKRDLFRRPLLSKELEKFDAVVFDPPRAGAEEQAKILAKSTVAKVVAVSCNPVTLARDLAILQDGGYKIEKIIPIDQFLFAPHVEVVAYLTKRKPKPGWKL